MPNKSATSTKSRYFILLRCIHTAVTFYKATFPGVSGQRSVTKSYLYVAVISNVTQLLESSLLTANKIYFISRFFFTFGGLNAYRHPITVNQQTRQRSINNICPQPVEVNIMHYCFVLDIYSLLHFVNLCYRWHGCDEQRTTDCNKWSLKYVA